MEWVLCTFSKIQEDRDEKALRAQDIDMKCFLSQKEKYDEANDQLTDILEQLNVQSGPEVFGQFSQLCLCTPP